MMKRNTIQRTLVFNAVQSLQNHATAEEIYQMLAAELPTISRGTVYRNLKELSASGKIRKVEVPGGADRFDHKCQNHYHVRCDLCGRVFDVEMEYMDGLEGKIRNANGFSFTGHDILFRGICPACASHPDDSGTD